MKAVVMAGGEGSRLRPITSNRPKPLVPVCNSPIMEHILTLLKRHGVTEVVTTLHYLADEIQGYFGDGSDFGVKMEYSIEDTPLGTAGSVKKAEEHIRSKDPFLIISGDALTDCDLTKAIEFHRAKKSLATLILYRVATPLDFGVVITDEEGRVVRFLEKPGWSEVFSDTVNTGMYILEPEIFELMESGRNYDWSGDIFPRLLEEGKAIYGFVMDEYWCDVGSLTQYREAQEHLMSGQVNLPLPYPVNDNNQFIGPNTSIDETASIVPPVVIGRNCKIKRGAKVGPYTVLGDNTLVEEEANVERSIIWDSVYIGAAVNVRSAVVGTRATIKRDCIISEDAVVGDRCLIDVGCTVRPRIKLWPDKIIERGSTVTMSLVWGNKWRGNLFRELGVAGLSNIEITPDFACRLGSAFGSCLSPRSRVVTSRDSTRSSRMIKRAMIAALLSVGCDILDLQSIALPVARHFIRTNGAAGAINVRKLPGNNRVTLIELLDRDGGYLSKNMERKVETAFFREDYKRIDSEDLGVIEYAARAIEGYQSEFFRNIESPASRRKLKVVCDYGYSSLASFYPSMLSNLGVESISLNSFNDAKKAPRTNDELQGHVDNLSQIVGTLGYDMGVLFSEEGERLTVVDARGAPVVGNTLLAALSILVGKTHRESTIAISITAPTRLEEALRATGVGILRTRSDVRSLMSATLENEITFAGDDHGGFIFPSMHPGFDAPFTFGKLIAMLQETGLSLSDITDELPEFQMAYEVVRCPWEAKGAVMRRLSEESSQGERVELVDGIKIYDRDSWVLVLPDSVEPVFHIYAESPDAGASDELVHEYVRKIEQMQVAV
jgi:mannose-1-phosphate guanylyltransferase/phosphomannomutase